MAFQRLAAFKDWVKRIPPRRKIALSGVLVLILGGGGYVAYRNLAHADTAAAPQIVGFSSQTVVTTQLVESVTVIDHNINEDVSKVVATIDWGDGQKQTVAQNMGGYAGPIMVHAPYDKIGLNTVYSIPLVHNYVADKDGKTQHYQVTLSVTSSTGKNTTQTVPVTVAVTPDTGSVNYAPSITQLPFAQIAPKDSPFTYCVTVDDYSNLGSSETLHIDWSDGKIDTVAMKPLQSGRNDRFISCTSHTFSNVTSTTRSILLWVEDAFGMRSSATFGEITVSDQLPEIITQSGVVPQQYPDGSVDSGSIRFTDYNSAATLRQLKIDWGDGTNDSASTMVTTPPDQSDNTLVQPGQLTYGRLFDCNLNHCFLNKVYSGDLMKSFFPKHTYPARPDGLLSTVYTARVWDYDNPQYTHTNNVFIPIQSGKTKNPDNQLMTQDSIEMHPVWVVGTENTPPVDQFTFLSSGSTDPSHVPFLYSGTRKISPTAILFGDNGEKNPVALTAPLKLFQYSEIVTSDYEQYWNMTMSLRITGGDNNLGGGMFFGLGQPQLNGQRLGLKFERAKSVTNLYLVARNVKGERSVVFDHTLSDDPSSANQPYDILLELKGQTLTGKVYQGATLVGTAQLPIVSGVNDYAFAKDLNTLVISEEHRESGLMMKGEIYSLGTSWKTDPFASKH